MVKRRTAQDHLDMMRNPKRWPCWPLLPLQHRTRREPDGTMNLLGFIIAVAGTAPKVYIGMIYFQSMGLKLEDLPVEEYPSFEAVVDAGWEVN